MGEFSPGIFARFLAKIAYSYAVAIYGYGNFKPLILDLIFAKTDGFRSWVGGEPVAPPPNENEIHSIRCFTRTVIGRNYLVVAIRLFSFLGTPIYQVVVGEI
jgi:hypothetical protein